MRILITGINGFAASHLARFLVEKGEEVHGTIRVRSDMHRIEDIKDKLTLHLVELSDSISVSNLIKEVNPEQIYHLAAQSYVGSSWKSPIETYQTNVLGTVNLLEAVRCMEKPCKTLVTSTSEVYGDLDGVLNEETNPNPNTHYGVSKYAQDMITRLYYRAYKLPVVVTRSFNITGAARADVFVDSNFAKQIAEMEAGKKEPVLRHGNLESARDFTDVKDVVNGYYLAMNKGKLGEVYCFCQEKPTQIKELLDILVKNSTVDVKTEVDPDRFRPVDTKTMIGDCTKAKTLGWKPSVPLEQSLIDLLNYWRKKI